MNVVGAVRTAIDMSSGSNTVTVICDGGQRHLTRFWNRDFIAQSGLEWPSSDKTNPKLPDCIALLETKKCNNI